MAKFIDGDGNEHTLAFKNQGELERIQDETGVALDRLFAGGDGSESFGSKVVEFLYLRTREFADFLAKLAGLEGEAAKKMRWSLDLDAFERGRVALLEAISDFCHQLPGTREQRQAEIRARLTNLSQLDGSNKATESAVPSE